MKRFKAIKRLKIENWLNNFLWVNIKTEKTERLFHSRKLHNNGKKFIFFSFWSYFSLSYCDIKGKPQLKYQRMVEINRKAFQIFQFLWSMIFFVFFESPKRRKLKQPKETRTCLTTVHLVRKTVKCFSEIVDLCNNNRTELTLMMDRNYSICCYSTYHCKIFPGPVGLNTRGTPHLFVVVISPPIRYHLNECDHMVTTLKTVLPPLPQRS